MEEKWIAMRILQEERWVEKLRSLKTVFKKREQCHKYVNTMAQWEHVHLNLDQQCAVVCEVLYRIR